MPYDMMSDIYGKNKPVKEQINRKQSGGWTMLVVLAAIIVLRILLIDKKYDLFIHEKANEIFTSGSQIVGQSVKGNLK